MKTSKCQEEINEISTQLKKIKKVKAPGPILGFLKAADVNYLIILQLKEKKTDYPSCGWTDTRQPMVISETEK
jgi:hypothetical protein